MGAAPILTILKDGETVRSVPIEGEALLGRDEGCVIRLEGRMISRQHALFSRKGDQIQVERKSEFAPLLVNGSDCTQAVLKEGDVIAIGPYLMKLSLQEKGAQAEAQAVAPQLELEAPAPVVALAPVSNGAPSDAVSLAPATSDEQALPGLDLQDGQAAQVSPTIEPLEQAPVENPEGGALQLGEPMAEAGLDVQQDQVLASQEASGALAPAEGDANGAIAFAPPDVDSSAADSGDATRVLSNSGPEMKLVFRPGDANVLDLKVDKEEISIGRGKDCDVVLNDKKASRKNSIISKNGPVVVIKDLGSSNGTYVNNEKISERTLAGGDKIKIGDVEFEFRADQPGYAEQEKDFLSVPAVIEASGPIELPAFSMDNVPMQVATPMSDPAQNQVPMQAMANAAPAGAGVSYEGIGASAAFPGMVPGMEGIAGISNDAAKNQKGFMARFRAMPKRTQWIVIVAVIVGGYFLFVDDDDDQPQTPKTKQTQGKKAKKKGADGKEAAESKTIGDRSFASLSKEKQDFIRTQHKLAFEYFQHQDYANALAAIKPIFEYVEDYEDSREIQRYAEDGIRQMKVIAEEKAKKEAEEAKARKLTELLTRARGFMEKKRYNDASGIFNDILVIDPENAQVSQWQAKIREYEEDLRVQAQKKQVQTEVSNQAWAVYKEGAALHKKGEFRQALRVLAKVKEIGAVDSRPARLAAEEIAAIHNEIQTQLEPLLKEGKEKEDAQDFVGAMTAYSHAQTIEPGSQEAKDGIGRVHGVLVDKAKILYTEAVLAESYSDFATAKKKFQQCIDTAPKDSIYYERGTRKLARYFKQLDDSAPPMGGAAGGGGP